MELPTTPTWGIMITNDGLAFLDCYALITTWGGVPILEGQRLFITARADEIADWLPLPDDMAERVEAQARPRSTVFDNREENT